MRVCAALQLRPLIFYQKKRQVGFGSNKNIRISKVVLSRETLGMTSEGLGELFEDDFSDTRAEKIPTVSMGDKRPCHACTVGDRGPPSAGRLVIFTFCV
jgi:hypothetical protein